LPKTIVIVYRHRTLRCLRRMSLGMEAGFIHSSTCPGCIEAAKRVAALEAQIASLQASVEQLRRGGKRQAAPFSKGSPKADPKPPGRKSGEDHGEHHRRKVPPRIDEVHEAALPACCPHCRGEVIETCVDQQYQAEIPRQVIYRQFNVHVGKCQGCDRRVQGRHPLQTSDALGAAASQIGPDAQALAVQLNKEAGLSHGKVKRFFKAAFDLELSRGGACRVMLRASRRCEPVYQAIVRRVQQSPSIVPDETGWRIGGMLAWLHVAVGVDATAYLVHRCRGYEASVMLIGEDYEGTMTHDAWSPYMHFIYAVHQTCLAHLLRRACELEQAAVGGAVRFPRQVKAILKSALAVRDQRDAGDLSGEQAAEQAIILGRQMNQLTSPRKTNPGNRRFAKHLLNQQESLFPFLQFEGIDATNYQAEQAIRPAAVNRKVWGGNRTEAGAGAQSILMSVLRTATQRGIDAVTFISQTLRATLGKQPHLIPETG
jgi:transposase